jgi:hypothetical protein
MNVNTSGENLKICNRYILSSDRILKIVLFFTFMKTVLYLIFNQIETFFFVNVQF